MLKSIMDMIPQRIKDRPLVALFKVLLMIMFLVAFLVMLFGRDFVIGEWQRFTSTPTMEVTDQ